MATAIPLGEYLNTSYRPDCEYLDGELLERNVGEFDHSRLQGLLAAALHALRKPAGIIVALACRVKTGSERIRVPDIVAVDRRPKGGIITEPPLLCVEVLSPRDLVIEMRTRVQDYLDFGVPNVWVIDPKTRLATIYTSEGAAEVSDGILSTKNPDITIDLNTLE